MKNEILKIKRKEHALSQAELADKVGVTRQTINMIEAGNYNPSIKLCLQICYALNATLDQLFWEDEKWKSIKMKDYSMKW